MLSDLETAILRKLSLLTIYDISHVGWFLKISTQKSVGS